MNGPCDCGEPTYPNNQGSSAVPPGQPPLNPLQELAVKMSDIREFHVWSVVGVDGIKLELAWCGSDYKDVMEMYDKLLEIGTKHQKTIRQDVPPELWKMIEGLFAVQKDQAPEPYGPQMIM